MRILALKAKLRLYERPLPEEKPENSCIRCEKHEKLAYECADSAVTLVKDRDKILPITPEKYRRILLVNIESVKSVRYSTDSQYLNFLEGLREKGFEVSEIDIQQIPSIGKGGASFGEISEKYDLILYYLGAKAG